MAYYMVNVMVLRIPSVEYKLEIFSCSRNYTDQDVYKKLQEDKNVLDFYTTL